jgi:hypothetical protein
MSELVDELVFDDGFGGPTTLKSHLLRAWEMYDQVAVAIPEDALEEVLAEWWGECARSQKGGA